MSTLDQFESVFKSAAKRRYHHQPVELERVLVLTDLDEHPTEVYRQAVATLLADALPSEVAWTALPSTAYATVDELLDRVASTAPRLIVTFRNLRTPARRFPHSLGTYVDVLTQATTIPVLLTPRPARDGTMPPLATIREVLVVTDRLTGADALVSYGAHFTPAGGRLVLAHIEDSLAFDRYIDAISKIAALNTDVAREEIAARLLKEPSEFVESVRDVLAEERAAPIEVEGAVGMGCGLNEPLALIEEHSVDLLIFDAKDDDQLAMHGLAYPLAIELRELPLLML